MIMQLLLLEFYVDICGWGGEREIFEALSLSLERVYSFASRKIRASVAGESKINSGLLKKV